MFRVLNDFLTTYESIVEGTQKCLDLLEDAHLDQAVAGGYRTIGQIAWHIVVTVPEMMSHTGLHFGGFDHESPPPGEAQQIAYGYRTVTNGLLMAIKASWSDASLLETDNMYGETWSKGQTLSALVFHEIHHRAQLTVLMRQAGIAVPGMYGPSKEEWKQYGMEEPAY